MSAIEYVRSALKYLAEEEVRKEEYISRDFHHDLDQINYRFLIDANCKTLAKVSIDI